MLFQLVGPRSFVYYEKGKKFYDRDEIFKEYEIEPWKIPDLLSLTGFKEKDLLGVLGIKRERVLKWLNFFSSTEELIMRLDLLEKIEDENTFHFQNLIKKQEKNLRRLVC